VLSPSKGGRTISRDLESGVTSSTVFDDFGCVRVEATRIEIASTRLAEYLITADDPLSACMKTRWTMDVGRGEWRTRSVSRTMMTATESEFRIQAELDAFEGVERICAREFDVRIRRDLV
jgi:hypothetical protein